MPTPLVSRPRPGTSQKKDVQTETYVALRDAAFILFPFSSFLPTFRAQKRGRDDAEPTPPLPVNALPISAHGASHPAPEPATETAGIPSSRVPGHRHPRAWWHSTTSRRAVRDSLYDRGPHPRHRCCRTLRTTAPRPLPPPAKTPSTPRETPPAIPSRHRARHT